jgi:hypothetical protein
MKFRSDAERRMTITFFITQLQFMEDETSGKWRDIKCVSLFLTRPEVIPPSEIRSLEKSLERVYKAARLIRKRAESLQSHQMQINLFVEQQALQSLPLEVDDGAIVEDDDLPF